MTCREVVEFLMEYLSGELPPEQHRAFTDHLDACPECVAYVKGYEEAVRLGKAAFNAADESVGDDVPEELVEAILATRRKPT